MKQRDCGAAGWQLMGRGEKQGGGREERARIYVRFYSTERVLVKKNFVY